jgi:hypothetical protein
MNIKFKKQFTWAAVLMLSGGLLWACGNDDSSAGSGSGSGTGSGTGTGTNTGGTNTTPTSEYTSTYKAIFNTNCVGCHNAGDTTDLSTLEKIKANKASVISRIESKTRPMPPSPTAQWTNTDKARVLQYLKTSTEVN